jgi:hypothetical protein
MAVKIVLLKSGETLITEAKQVVAEDHNGIQAYIFTKPYVISVNQPYPLPHFLIEDSQTDDNSLNIILSPWIIFTSDTNIPVNPDWVVSIVDPIEDILKMYNEKVK